MTVIAKLRNIVQMQFWISLWTGILTFVGTVAVVIYMSHQPATRIVDLHEIDGIAVRGGMIDLMATVDRYRDCPSDVRRWLWRPINDGDGKPRKDVLGKPVTEWISIGVPASPPVPIGNNTYVLHLPVPQGIQPGRWFYVGIARDRCSWWPGVFGDAPRMTQSTPIEIDNPTAEHEGSVTLPPGPFEALPSVSVK